MKEAIKNTKENLTPELRTWWAEKLKVTPDQVDEVLGGNDAPTIKLVHKGKESYDGKYNPLTNTIRINLDLMTSPQIQQGTIIHEMTHYFADVNGGFGVLRPEIDRAIIDYITMKRLPDRSRLYWYFETYNGYTAEYVHFGGYVP